MAGCDRAPRFGKLHRVRRWPCSTPARLSVRYPPPPAWTARWSLRRRGATGFVFVRNGTHFGPAAHWALRAAAHDCIGFCVSNGGGVAGVLAYGSREVALTNGPIAWAIPGGRHPALVADMAVGAAAMGKVRVAQAAGTSIPADWGVDASGQPTTDPAALVNLIPFAGPKGFGSGS